MIYKRMNMKGKVWTGIPAPCATSQSSLMNDDWDQVSAVKPFRPALV